MTRKLGIIYLLLFEGIIGTIGVAHSLLLTQGTPWESTTWFYIMMWVSSMIILLWTWVSFRETSQYDYNEALTSNKFYLIIGGYIAMLIISSVMVSSYTQSSIWVPQPNQTLSLGGLSLSTIINDMLFTFALVANSEEVLVLGIMQVLRRWLTTVKSLPLWSVSHLAIIIPRVGWGLLHAYVSYLGPLQLLLVVSAIVSGCIMSYIAYYQKLKVESLLGAVFMHGLFNISVIIAGALRLM